MSKTTVYRFTIYDITSDEGRLSRRMGTREAIAWAKGEPVEEATREAEETDLGREVAGMTDRDYWMWGGVASGLPPLSSPQSPLVAADH